MTVESFATTSISGSSSAVEYSFLLVTYNSQPVLAGLISSLINCPPTDRWELIAVDNASDDKSADVIETSIPNATVIRSDRNHGFARAVNLAAGLARGRYLCCVNPDIEWEHGVIDQLRTCIDGHERVSAVVPKLVYPDGRPQLNIRRFPTHANIWWSRGTPWWRWTMRHNVHHRYTCEYPASAQPIEAAGAACLLISRAAFESMGGFDADYFLYVEDTDFCRRLHDAGSQVWCEPAVSVVHHWGEGTRRDPQLARYHRDGIRRYFRKFHGSKRIRNAILFTALRLADFWPAKRSRLNEEGDGV